MTIDTHIQRREPISAGELLDLYEKHVRNLPHSLLAEDRIPFVTGQAYQVEIGAAGGLIEISVDGVVVFSLEDSALVTAAAAF